MTTIDTARLRALAEAAHSDAEPNGSRDPKAWAAYLRAVAAFQVAAGPPTLIALLDEIERLQGEWEYGTALPEATQEDGMGYANEMAALAHAARCGECVLVRRRKAGPWEPVTGDDDA